MDLDTLNTLRNNILNISFFSDSEHEPDDTFAELISWNFTEMTEWTLKVLLEFSNPIQVSAETRDSVSFTFGDT